MARRLSRRERLCRRRGALGQTLLFDIGHGHCGEPSMAGVQPGSGR